MASPALQNVTVNGQPASQFLARQKSEEILQVYRETMREMFRSKRAHITSSNGNRNTTVARQDGDRVRYR